MVDQLAEKFAQKALSRRNFLAGAGAITAATMVGCSDNTTITPTQPVAPTPPAALTDVDVLNFALNLEYLEAEFYLRAATGAGIPATDQLTGAGAVTVKANSKVTFSNPFFQQIAYELAQTELQHVRAIQATIKALKGTPVSAPALDYTNGFNGAANAAGIGTSFDPFASDLAFFVGALTFEDVGVTAYTGAAKLLKDKGVLSAAAGIQAAEAYHAGSLRTLLVGNALSTKSQTYLNYYNQIIQLRGKLGGGNETVLNIGGTASMSKNASGAAITVYTPSSIVQADATNSIGFARNTDQVLHIVYATMPGTFTASGGFFPSGVNGTIKQPTT